MHVLIILISPRLDSRKTRILCHHPLPRLLLRSPSRIYPGFAKGGTKVVWLVVCRQLGIVYGDIGTSPPLCPARLFGAHAVPPTYANVPRLVTYLVSSSSSVKYLILILGRITAAKAVSWRWQHWSTTLHGAKNSPSWAFRAALLYADGMITPAISVLSAVEGLNVATRMFDPYVVAIAVAILSDCSSSNPVARRSSKVFGPSPSYGHHDQRSRIHQSFGAGSARRDQPWAWYCVFYQQRTVVLSCSARFPGRHWWRRPTPILATRHPVSPGSSPSCRP